MPKLRGAAVAYKSRMPTAATPVFSRATNYAVIIYKWLNIYLHITLPGLIESPQVDSLAPNSPGSAARKFHHSLLIDNRSRRVRDRQIILIKGTRLSISKLITVREGKTRLGEWEVYRLAWKK